MVPSGVLSSKAVHLHGFKHETARTLLGEVFIAHLHTGINQDGPFQSGLSYTTGGYLTFKIKPSYNLTELLLFPSPDENVFIPNFSLTSSSVVRGQKVANLQKGRCSIHKLQYTESDVRRGLSLCGGSWELWDQFFHGRAIQFAPACNAHSDSKIMALPSSRWLLRH